MPGFYEKAVVWLGLNEEYEDDHDSGVALDGAALDDATVTSPVGTPAPSPSPKEDASPKKTRSQVVEGARHKGREEGGEEGSARDRQSLDAGSSSRYGGQSVGEGRVRALPMEQDSADRTTASRTSYGEDVLRGGTVRAVPMVRTTKPHVVVPRSFNDAQDVADMFREKKPVIVNMQSAERDLARRLIDFSSGLCYGLGGQMEKVAKDVYLLTPDEVEVADEDRVVPES